MSNSMPANREQILPRLREVFFFKQWPPADLEQIAPHVKLVNKEKGDLLFLQNDPCNWLYFLLRGQVQMFVDSEDGREITLHVLSPGALVACAALFLGKAYPASARVTSGGAELLAIEGEAFLGLLAARPDLSKRMIAALASRISELATRLESHSSESAEQRLVRYLLEQPSRPSPEGKRVVTIDGSKKSVAAGLGMTPETFSRSLRKLSDLGAIRVEARTIVIEDARALEDAGAE